MKVSIIGAGGRVGSTTAYALQLGGIVNEIALIDVFMADQTFGEALDLLHGTSLIASQKIYSGGYEALKGSDVIVITSGLRRKPDEERLALINRNAEMFRSIVKEIKAQKLNDDAVILVVSNPVDILTYVALKESGLPPSRVIGLGTMLDTVRFRSLLADKFGVAPTDVSALLLGEHGDTMFPVWSTASVGAVPLKSLPNYDRAAAEAVFERARLSGAEMIKTKGGAGAAVGLSIRKVVHAILLNTGEVLPVSTLQESGGNLTDVCLSVPTRVGRAGAIEHIAIELSESEEAALQSSAAHLKSTLAQVI
jgi:L-lactate dehydrogenase